MNHGPHQVVIDAFGWPTGRVIDEADAVVRVFVGARAGVGRPPLVIGPGSSATTSFLGGTSSTDPHLGPALPPGNYRLVVTLEARLGTHEDSPRGLLLSAAVALAIRN